jgi:hypothetical protein
LTLYNPSARLIWSLASSGLGTTLSAAGNSGGWTGVPNDESAVDLRDVTDILLAVTCAGPVTGGAPSLMVQVDIFDAAGNVYPQVLKLAAPFTSVAYETASGGLHDGGGGNYIVLPSWGRVSWTVGTGSFAATEIELFGR